MIHNFRVASMTPEVRTAALEALTTDLEKLHRENPGMGIVEAVESEPKFKLKMSKLIREAVTDEIAITDLTPVLTERRTATLGDKLEVEVKFNNLRVVQYSPQSHPLVFSPVKGKYTVSTEMFELAWGIELFKVMTRQHKLEDFVQYAAQAVTRHYQQFTLGGLYTGLWGQTDPRSRPLSTDLSATSPDITKVALDAALRRMGTNVVIYGSRYALTPIFEFGAVSESQKDEFYRRGVIGSYRGARMAVVDPDFHVLTQKWTAVKGIDWEKLIFIVNQGEKPAVFYERDLTPLNWSTLDPKTSVMEAGTRMDHGLFVNAPHNAHVIRLQ